MIALTLTAPGVADALRWVPLLVSLVVLGLPHGAVDHHVPARLRAAVVPWRFSLGYVVLVVLGLALWALAPVGALALFLVVSVVHWGTADVWVARRLQGRPAFGGWWPVAAFAAARGLLPVALPVLAHPRAAADGLDAILAATGSGAAVGALSDGLRAAGLVVVVVVVGLALAAAARDGGRPTLAREAAECAVLAAAAVVVDPVLAVGTYFVAWHAPRHVARLMSTDDRQAALVSAGRPLVALAAFHREAAPLTAVSLAGLGALALTAWAVPGSASGVVGAALALIAALTVPHALVVAWMDRRAVDVPPRVSCWPVGRPIYAAGPVGSDSWPYRAGRPVRTLQATPSDAINEDTRMDVGHTHIERPWTGKI